MRIDIYGVKEAMASRGKSTLECMQCSPVVEMVSQPNGCNAPVDWIPALNSWVDLNQTSTVSKVATGRSLQRHITRTREIG